MMDNTVEPKDKEMQEQEESKVNGSELSPMFLAIKNDDLKAFEAAIKGKVKLEDEKSGAGFNILHYAASLLRADIMRFIIDNKLIPIDEKIKKGKYLWNTALHLTCLAAETYPGRAIEAVELLLNNKADINARNGKGFTPIFSAIQGGHPELVEYLLSKDANLIRSRTINDKSTLLHFAMNSCKRPMLKLLIDKDNAMMHAINEFNFEPIHQAAALGCVDGLKELILTRMIGKQHKSPLRNGAKYKTKYSKIYLFGATPLHFAARFNQLEALKFLFLIQSEFNATDENGNTAQEVAESASVSKEVRDYFKDRKIWEAKRVNIQDAENLVRLTEALPLEKQKEAYENLRKQHLHQ